MKKIIIILIIILLTTGCANKFENKIEDNKDNKNKEENKIEEKVDTYIDDNPITLGLYMNGKLINEYEKEFIDGEDIASFDVYFTNELDVGSSNTKNNFKKYYQQYENIDDYKIGYFVSYDTDEKHYEKVILDSDNEFSLWPCIYIYLYDDINQPDGTFYNHVTKDTENEDTIFSSIKLYLAEEGNTIISPISLMVFTYNDIDDFDENGYYRGKSSYSIKIYNK